MNFSEWDSVNAQPRGVGTRLRGICKEIQSGGMPLTSYLLIHWNAKLSPDDNRVVCEWTVWARQQVQTRSFSIINTSPN
jgi:hypothetical protein